MTSAEYMRQWRKTNPDYQNNWERAHLAAVRAAKRRWWQKNGARYQRQRRRARQMRDLARTQWSLFRRRLKIKAPPRCEQCHQQARTQAHHPDYRFPLQVRWLCYACHLAAHGRTQRP